MNDQQLRYEMLKIASDHERPSGDMVSIIFDANTLFKFVKDGAMPQLDTNH